MRVFSYRVAIVSAFAANTVFLVWTMKIYPPPEPVPFEWEHFAKKGMVLLLAAAGITILSRLKGICWRRAAYLGVYVSVVCASVLTAAVPLARSEHTWWPFFAAVIGAAIGFAAVLLDAYVMPKAAGWR